MRKITTISSSLVLSCLASQVFAAGFAIQEQNVTNLGLAYSGTAALAEDATTGYFNPAGLTQLGESEVVLGGVLIHGDFDFTATRATASLPELVVIIEEPITTAPILVPGSNEDNPGRTSGVPFLAVSKRLDDQWVLGFNVNVPWGLDTQYEDTGIARYLATYTSLQTLNFSPSIAYEFTPCLSLGFGVDAEYAKAALYTRIGNGNAALDGFQKNRAEGWGYGWHAGLLWSPWETTRIGLHYRSHVNIRAQGNSENLVSNAFVIANGVVVPAAFFPLNAGTYTIQRVHSEVTLPEIATISLYHAFNDCYAFTADVAWTNWSRFHTLRLRFNPGASIVNFAGTFSPGLDTDTWEHFKDARRYAIGLIYTHSDEWLFRIGTAYDESPVRDDFRTARIPDENRVWAAIGGAYTYSECLKFDFGYAHIFFKDATLNERAPFIAGSDQPITFATLQGSYKGSANLLGLQIRYDFV